MEDRTETEKHTNMVNRSFTGHRSLHKEMGTQGSKQNDFMPSLMKGRKSWKNVIGQMVWGKSS